MKISSQGIELIKKFEGFSATPYLCPAGKWTVGYGHVLSPHLLRGPVTIEQAENLLLSDLAPVEAAINRLVAVPLTQNQFDALCSLVYNIGVGAFAKSTLLRLLKQPPQQVRGETSAQFLRWVYGGGTILPGLQARREAEKYLFEK